MGSSLGTWSRRKFKGMKLGIKRKQLQLDAILQGSVTKDKVEEISVVKSTLNVLLEQEETFWVQRSKVSWLREGDRNAGFFHARASCCRRKNTIASLSNETWHWISKKDDITHMIRSIYLELV